MTNRIENVIKQQTRFDRAKRRIFVFIRFYLWTWNDAPFLLKNDKFNITRWCNRLDSIVCLCTPGNKNVLLLRFFLLQLFILIIFTRQNRLVFLVSFCLFLLREFNRTILVFNAVVFLIKTLFDRVLLMEALIVAREAKKKTEKNFACSNETIWMSTESSAVVMLSIYTHFVDDFFFLFFSVWQKKKRFFYFKFRVACIFFYRFLSSPMASWMYAAHTKSHCAQHNQQINTE